MNQKGDFTMVKFGTGGWRAIIGDDFTKQNIQTLAKALATKMKDEGVTEKGIVMGYDRRFLSKEAMQWAAVVFATEGIKAYLINKSSPTPLVMFYVMKHEFPYAKYIPLQYLLMQMQTKVDFLVKNSSMIGAEAANIMSSLPQDSLRMALVVLIVIPIACAYPFFQRYIISGLTIGSVKG